MTFELTILQSVPLPPLGVVGWIILLLLFIASCVLNLIQQRKSKGVEVARQETQQAQNETSHWRGTAGAFEKELVIVRERCTRLEEVNTSQSAELLSLRQRTNLDSLRVETANIAQMLATEGKRAQEMHEAILHSLESMAQAITEMNQRALERDQQYATLINSQSELIKSLQSQMNLRAALAN
jgi:hypothetical protein